VCGPGQRGGRRPETGRAAAAGTAAGRGAVMLPLG
jgi:hypothetical protein